MNIVLVAGLVAPSLAFEFLGEALEKRGASIMKFLGHGKPTGIDPDILRNTIQFADMEVTGISTPEEKALEELSAIKLAREFQKPLGLYADTYDVFRRKWFATMRPDAKFLFVLDEGEAKSARVLYPNAEIIASGNPTWESYNQQRFSRQEVRQQLGIGDFETAVLCTGGTVARDNQAFLIDIILALGQVSGHNWKILFSAHPGDLAFRDNPAIYDALKEKSAIPIRFVGKSEMATFDVIPGSDFIIDMPGSSIGVAGAFQRKKVICYFRTGALDALERAIDVRVWRPCARGVMYEVHDPKDFVQAFAADYTLLLQNQERYYPVPPLKSEVVDSMVCTIERNSLTKK